MAKKRSPPHGNKCAIGPSRRSRSLFGPDRPSSELLTDVAQKDTDTGIRPRKVEKQKLYKHGKISPSFQSFRASLCRFTYTGGTEELETQKTENAKSSIAGRMLERKALLYPTVEDDLSRESSTGHQVAISMAELLSNRQRDGIDAPLRDAASPSTTPEKQTRYCEGGLAATLGATGPLPDIDRRSHVSSPFKIASLAFASDGCLSCVSTTCWLSNFKDNQNLVFQPSSPVQVPSTFDTGIDPQLLLKCSS
ncbi:uncharacterized protein N7446_010644 [Penicillium canescens]|uniref:Uncharacterized protein n=1 Tax=Penicillium canescens TaxID=5083 RepID=A0AAD6IBJ6_PENCN|nr:uncharacterized protein N7446_010644 [Penicillium canescens]KAJ6041471.1 hypothetical protein N7460_006861 [Penicillium canescens]KAJ6050535.1 hypothetical protein N7446_010644 [Penicillium canescens]KAJ6064837.1 hypothetical protein N7444_000490 [Penicillium canescens]